MNTRQVAMPCAALLLVLAVGLTPARGSVFNINLPAGIVTKNSVRFNEYDIDHG